MSASLPLNGEVFLLSAGVFNLFVSFFCSQSMSEKTVRCLMACLSFASSQQVDLLVCYSNYTSHNPSVAPASYRSDIYDIKAGNLE